MSQKKYVSLSRLSNFLDNIKARYSLIGHKHTTKDITDYVVDSELSSTSNNPVANRVLNAEFDAISDGLGALELAIDGKSDAAHSHDDRYYTETEINQKLSEKADSSHTHTIANVTNLQTSLDSKVPTSRTINSKPLSANITLSASDVGAAPSSHNHNDVYYTETEIDTKLSTINTSINDIKSGEIVVKEAEHADSADTATSANHATSADSATSATKATQDGNGKVISSTYETKTDAASKLTEAKTYADNVANTVKNDLLNNAGAAYDTLKELGDLIDDNKDAIDALEDIASGKANAVHTHTVSDVSGLQSALDGKAASSHGTHVTYSTTAPVMDGTASVGTASTVARSDHKHPTDTSRASKTEFDAHDANTTKHITAIERTNWNAAKTHADSAHAPSNAQPNQNAFSNIKVGSTTIAADTVTDTLTFEGTNVTITPDATNDKVTIAVADATTSAKGVVQLTDSVTSTSTTTAATPKNVKAAYDLANTAKTTADGKANASHTHTVANITDLTATATELNYMDGVTSNVQAQLDELENAKAEKIHIHPYGVCSTDAATAAKTVTVSDFALTTGVRVVVKFTTTNTASSPTLNVNGTGAKNIYYNGRKIYSNYLAMDKVYEFVYDGSYWILVGDNITDLMDTSDPTGTGKISINRKANTTSGTKSVAMGNNPTASGNFSVALGEYTTASGEASFAEGSYTTSSGMASHAEGDHTTASADASHSEGNSTTASGFASHSEGNSTIASGKAAHAEGYITKATGEYSHSEGYYTEALSDYQHVQGAYNIEDADGKYLHIVGNGRDNDGSVIPSNAHTIDWDGNGWFQGNVYVGGESQDDYGVSKLMKESDYEWNLIYNSGSITAKANSISGIDISGYKRIMVAASCVNDGTNISKSGSVIFTGTHGQTYQFPCWTNMFSTTANATSAGIAQFDIIYGYIVCPTALRSIRTSNFLTAGEGGTADNLTSTGGGIMRCTDDLTTLTVSSLDQDANCFFGVGSKVMVWGCKV